LVSLGICATQLVAHLRCDTSTLPVSPGRRRCWKRRMGASLEPWVDGRWRRWNPLHSGTGNPEYL